MPINVTMTIYRLLFGFINPKNLNKKIQADKRLSTEAFF